MDIFSTAVQYTNSCSILSENSGTPFCDPVLIYGGSSVWKNHTKSFWRFTSSVNSAGFCPIEFRPRSNLQLLQVFCWLNRSDLEKISLEFPFLQFVSFRSTYLRTNNPESKSTVNGTLQDKLTHWRTQAKLTRREMIGQTATGLTINKIPIVTVTKGASKLANYT